MVIKNDKDLMMWIRDNLGSIIRHSLTDSPYTESHLAGICARETGFLIVRYNNRGKSFEEITGLMRGDYSRRPGESSKRYHGYSYWQIDINSYPQFIKAGDWLDPVKSCVMAASVLKEKHGYLFRKGWSTKLCPDMFLRAVTAAYNCGQGNVHKALSRGLNVDYYTFNHDYSKEVFRFKKIYEELSVV